jgi:hypothetical protein
MDSLFIGGLWVSDKLAYNVILPSKMMAEIAANTRPAMAKPA